MPVNVRLVGPAVERVLQRVDNPRRLTDAEYGRKDRKYLRPAEVEQLIRGAKAGRHGQRDGLMVSLAYHHAFRVSELIELEWDQIDLKAGTIDIAPRRAASMARSDSRRRMPALCAPSSPRPKGRMCS
jgi:integrase